MTASNSRTGGRIDIAITALAPAAWGLTYLVTTELLPATGSTQLDAIGVLGGLTGAASMAIGVVLTKRWGRPVPLTAFTAWQLVAGSLLLAPIALVIEGAPPHLTASNLIGLGWLATGGTALAYLL